MSAPVDCSEREPYEEHERDVGTRRYHCAKCGKRIAERVSPGLVIGCDLAAVQELSWESDA